MRHVDNEYVRLDHAEIVTKVPLNDAFGPVKVNCSRIAISKNNEIISRANNAARISLNLLPIMTLQMNWLDSIEQKVRFVPPIFG